MFTSGLIERLTGRVYRPLLAIAVCVAVATLAAAQEDLDVEFGFQENDWSDPDTLQFKTTPITDLESAWGNEDETDFYVETGTTADTIDAFIPGAQAVKPGNMVVLEFQSRFLTDATNHSYFGFAGEVDPSNAIWFGHGGGRFHVGVGRESNLSGSTPTGSLASFDPDDGAGSGVAVNDSRIGVRLGFDVAQSQIRNFQVDLNNDGDFDREFIDLTAGESIDLPDVSPLDWFLLTYAGRGGSRADDVAARQQESRGDYNSDLDFDEEDVNIFCRDGIAAGNLEFDYNQDGMLNEEDVSDFAFEHGSLPGDLDFNGSVEFADFLVFSDQFGQSALYSQGDITCDGRADFADFLLLSTFFGSSASPQRAETLHSVPEPTTIWLTATVIICCAGACRQRR